MEALQPSLGVPSYPQAGEVIDGKYQVERILGEGGMGAVARAQHLLRKAPVALKFMSPMVISFPGAVERFMNEAVAASQIDSEHVVKVFDVGKLSNGAPYMVMECLEGRDLDGVLEQEGSPGIQDVPRTIHFVLQALRGLQVAHEKGIVHRDMKPSNCFVIDKEGEKDFVKLLDFGISKVQQGGDGSLTQTNSALGTPLYMSPEQAKSARSVDHRSDLYSVAVILYELLTGRTPFTSDTGEFTEILFKIFTTDPPDIRELRPDLPEELCQVIHKALAREPNDRFGSAAEMCEALVPWADDRSRQVVQRIRHAAASTGKTTAQGVLGSRAASTLQLGGNAPAMGDARTDPTWVETGAVAARTQVDATGPGAPATRRSAAWIVPLMLLGGVGAGVALWKLPGSRAEGPAVTADPPERTVPSTTTLGAAAAPAETASSQPTASAAPSGFPGLPTGAGSAASAPSAGTQAGAHLRPTPVHSGPSRKPPRLNDIGLHD